MNHNKLSRKLLKVGIVLFVAFLLIEECSCKKKKDKEKESLEDEKSDESKESKKGSGEKKESDEGKKDSEEKDDEVSSAEKAKKHGLFSRVKLCQGLAWERPRILDKSQKHCDKEPDKERTGAICSALCLWDNADLVEKGKIDVKAVEDLADAMMIGALEHNRKWLKTEWNNCQIRDLDEEKKDTDSKCKKWKRYFTCILESFKTVCKGQRQPPQQQHQGGGGGGGLLGLSLGKK